MNEDQTAIVRALVPVAWADGTFAETERQMLEGLLEGYGASEDQKRELLDYAKEKRTLNDINLQDLSAGDRRVVLQLAVLLAHADGEKHALESQFLETLATKLKIPESEAKEVVAQAEARVKKNLKLRG